MRWAAAELEGITTVKKSKLEEYQLVEEELGTYEPLEMIVKYEGGHQSANAVQLLPMQGRRKCSEAHG